MITTTSADGTEVRAYDEGRGPVILILHPGMDDGSMWGKVAARLATRFRVVRLHRRQYRLDLPHPCSMSQEVDDVRAIAEVIAEPTAIVGHSSGAVVALEAMAASPSTFAGGVVYDPPVATATSPPWGEPLARAKAALAADRPGKAIEIFVRDIAGFPSWLAVLSGAYVAVRPRYRAFAPRQIADAAAIDRLGIRLDTYSRITTPTVLLVGARSPANLGARVEALSCSLPHAEKVVLPRQGHDANRRAPDEVTRIITALTDRVLP